MDSFGSLTFLGQSDCTARSMVKALDTFLKSVQQMKNVVMVPNRLKDIQATLSNDEVTQDDLWSVPSKSHSQKLAMTPYGTRNGSVSIDLYSFYNMLGVIRNELVCGSPNNKTMKSSSSTASSLTNVNNLESLDSQYNSMSEEELEDDRVACNIAGKVANGSNFDVTAEYIIDDQHAVKLAAVFREHLTGLFMVLRQLTDAADCCSKKYQDEVGGKTQ